MVFQKKGQPLAFLVASFNAGKVSEMNEILGSSGIVCQGLHEISENSVNFFPRKSRKIWEEKNFDKIENGKTFQENAERKANCIWQMTGRPCLAEDSGLEIDALNGMPGIRSARYGNRDWCGQKKLSDQERCEFILKELSLRALSRNDRAARFVCTLALRWEEGIFFFFGVCEGFISFKMQGSNGFGYDPIFQPRFRVPLRNKRGAFSSSCKRRPTFAEMSRLEKNLLSHRRQACVQMMKTFAL